MEYIVRELLPEDINVLEGLVETLSHLSNVGDIGRKDIINLIENMQSQGSHVYVALENKKIIGMATLLVEQKISHNGSKAGHLEDVVVNPSYEGKGIGFNIVKEIQRRAKEEGCYKLVLDCNEELIAYYKRLGFNVSGAFMRMDFS